jgi:L-iditol 2-dehydrogenase
MLQAILQKPQTIIFREVDKPIPGPEQVLLKVEKVGICGSDIHAYYGHHPYISCPIVQGHEFSGTIVEMGERVKEFRIGLKATVRPQMTCGDCYACARGDYHICEHLKVIGCQVGGAAQQYYAVDRDLVVPLPEEMDFVSGAMIEPAAVGVHAVRRLGDVTGKRIVVLGAGPIGNLTAQAAKSLGAKSVLITDISDAKLDIAQQCGIDATVNTTGTDLKLAVMEQFGNDLADAIFECVGIGTTANQAIELSRKGADIVIVGVFGQKPNVDIGLVQDKELRLIGTLMYKSEDYETALELIRSKKIILDPLISKSYPFEEFDKAYQYIEDHRDRTMKVMIDVSGGEHR